MKGKISIRVSDSLRDKLSEMAESEKVSVSEVSRTILENYFSSNTSLKNASHMQSFQEQPIDEKFIDVVENEVPNQGVNDVAFSKEFFQLVIWIYDQKESRKLKLSNSELETFKNTIIKIHSSSKIPKGLMQEFDKVFVCLVKLINEKYESFMRPEFAYGGDSGFNYDLLKEFIFPEKKTLDLLTLKSNSYD